MTTQITTIDTNNYAEMAKAMGIAAEGGSTKERQAHLLVFVLTIRLSWAMTVSLLKGVHINWISLMGQLTTLRQ